MQQEILRLLFIKSGKSLNQLQIARFLKVSQPAIMKSLPKLGQEEYIKSSQDKETKRWSIGLNRNNPQIMQLKKIDNLRLIYESNLADYLEEKFAETTIILFGSYSRGEDIINSDIDIAIIGRKDKLIDLSSYENILERKININCYDSLKNINKHLKENLFNGILLAGGFEI